MKLDKKKALAARMLNVGKDRIWFNPQRLKEIKEAITKQDIKELVSQKIVLIKEITGTKKKKKRKTRRKAGSISKKVRKSKRDYMNKIRKLRLYLKRLKAENKISSADYRKLRNYSKSGIFKDLKHLREYLKEHIK